MLKAMWAQLPLGWAPPGKRMLCAALALASLCLTHPCVCAGGEPEPALAEPLPPDPQLLAFALDNGMRYAVRRVAKPERQVLLRLVVRAGSLYEPDGEEGAAHLTSQTLFATALRLDAGRAISEIPGALADLSYRSRSAMVDFESATFTLRIPMNDQGTITTALRFLSDVATGRALSDEEVIEEVQPEIVALEEARNTVGARMRQQLFPEIFAGTRMAQHPPFCPVDELCRLHPNTLRRFHESRYRPSEMAVLIVGDVDADAVEQLIAQEFGAMAPAAPADVLAPVAPPERRGGALVLADPELTAAIAEISFVSAYEGGMSTRADLLRRLSQNIIAYSIDHRLRQRNEMGQADYLDTEAWIGAASGPIEIAVASVEGDPVHWSSMVQQLASEVASLSRHGLTQRELSEASEAVLAELARLAEAADGVDSMRLLRELTEADLNEAAVLAPVDRLELSRELIAELDLQSVNDLAKRRFDLEHASLLLLLPSDAPAPVADDLSRVASAAFEDAAPFQPISKPVPTIITRRPEAGRVVSVDLDPETEISSAWLSSGVRIHHDALETEPGRLAISVTIAGGQIQEDQRTRGLTNAGASVFSSPATTSRSTVDLRRALVGQSLRSSTRVEDDRILLRIEAAHTDIELAFQLIHVLLTDPVLEGATFESWRWRQARHLKRRAQVPAAKALDLLAQTRRPRGENHEEPLTHEELDALTRNQVQQWITTLVNEGPIEVAIVGDLSRSEAFELAALYLGSIAPRARIGPNTFCELRHPGRPLPRDTIKQTIATASDEAALLLAIPGADECKMHESMLLDVAARVLANRIDVEAMQRRRVARDIFTEHSPGVAFPDSGLILTFARTEPNLVKPLLEILENAYAELARHGPTDAELEFVARQLRGERRQRRESLPAWADRLATIEYRATDVSELFRADRQLRKITTADVREAFAAHDPGPGKRLRLIVFPEAPAEHEPAPQP